MSNHNFTLIESEARIILESLITQEAKYVEICSASDDEDEVADYGNDLIELRFLLKRLKEEFISAYGPSVLEFGRDVPANCSIRRSR